MLSPVGISLEAASVRFGVVKVGTRQLDGGGFGVEGTVCVCVCVCVKGKG